MTLNTQEDGALAFLSLREESGVCVCGDGGDGKSLMQKATQPATSQATARYHLRHLSASS